MVWRKKNYHHLKKKDSIILSLWYYSVYSYQYHYFNWNASKIASSSSSSLIKCPSCNVCSFSEFRSFLQHLWECSLKDYTDKDAKHNQIISSWFILPMFYMPNAINFSIDDNLTHQYFCLWVFKRFWYWSFISNWS